METKKQEAIRLAYVTELSKDSAFGLDLYNEMEKHIDENGWIDASNSDGCAGYLMESDCEFNIPFVRLKSLSGIEDNNGWISLKGVANEITDRCSMWIMTKNGIEYLKENEFLPIGYATHYQPIQKPNPPIF